MFSAKVFKSRSERKGFLLDFWDITQNILVFTLLIIEIEAQTVDTHKPQKCYLVTLRWANTNLCLRINVVGQKWQTEQFEKQLQIGLSHRKEIGGF